MRRLDNITIEEYSISSLQLMRNAAGALKNYIDITYDKEDHIMIVCGPGNNGGDGFALATLLVQAKYQHVVIQCEVTLQQMSQDEKVYANEALRMGITIQRSRDYASLSQVFAQQDVIVDALFGTGLTRNITGDYAQLIDAMNHSNQPILSVDIASGIHSDTGMIMGCAVKASTTITFECAVCGQMIYPGSFYCGTLYIEHIGIPEEVVRRVQCYPIIDEHMVHKLLPQRVQQTHKGSYGKVLLIGGSTAMHGALTLCAKSILRSGVGTLTLCIPDCIVSILSQKIEESMIMATTSKQGYFGSSVPQQVRNSLSAYDTIVIGNGMGRNEISDELMQVVLESNKPCIIDGDGIFACAKQLHRLKQHQAPIIVTPHPKEMSYLTGLSVDEIKRNPFQVVKQFAKEYHIVVVLKDQYTFLSDGEDILVNVAGNNALAKGGSGDVLCGIISGLFAQSKQALSASACGVYVHAKCADVLIEREDANSILPSDIIEELSHIYKALR